MASYPTSISTDATLYIAVNNKRTQLNGAIDAVVTTITVDSTTGFPATGLASIDTEIFSYTSINATQFLGVTRGVDGTTAASHVDDSFVVHRVVAAHHNVLKDEVIAVETALGTNLSNVVTTTGVQSIAGAKTFTDPITQNDTSNQIVLGVTNTTTISATAPAASRVVTIPDPGAAADFVMTQGTQTISGIKTFDGQLIGKGTATNDSAASGYIGEYIESVIGTTSYPASGTVGDATSISLPAGDWEVSVVTLTNFVSGVVSTFSIGVTSTSGNSTAGTVVGSNYLPDVIGPTSGNNCAEVISGYRVSLSGTTTYYLKYVAGYTVGAPQIRARLSARRLR